MDFRAWAAGPRIAHLPEVILQAKLEDAIIGHSKSEPKIARLAVARDYVMVLRTRPRAKKGRNVEPVARDAVIFGDQVPGELDGVGLEVIAKRKIAQHFKEGMVPAGVADILQIVVFAARAHTFLGGGGARVVALLEAQEDVLKLVHARVGEQQSRIVRGDQRGGRQYTMPPCFKKLKKRVRMSFDFILEFNYGLGMVNSE